MVAGDVEGDPSQDLLFPAKVEGEGHTIHMHDVFGIVVVGGGIAEGEDALIKAGDGFLGIQVIAVDDKDLGGLFGKLPEGGDEVLHGLEVIQMVGVDVQDHGDIGIEL